MVLSAVYAERMRWPHGHHTRPELPLMYMGLSSQKNDMVVYMLFLLHNKAMREWFEKTWRAGAVGRSSSEGQRRRVLPAVQEG